jgi:K+-transporting ATPase ATPase C chain
MRRDLISSALAVLVLTLVLGVAYPLAVTGVSQVVFPGRADGQLIHHGDRVVGSKLLAQRFASPAYFQPRPSQSDYSASATLFSNRGPNDAEALTFYRKGLRAYLRRERPYVPGLTAPQVPVDAVTTSASGVDPGVSQANARIQAHRIAARRHLPLSRVMALVADHTNGRSLGVLGEPGVNVTTLNLALDQVAPRS